MDGVGNSTTNTPDLEKDKHIPDPYRNFNLGLNFQWEADIWGKLTDKKRSTAKPAVKVEASKVETPKAEAVKAEAPKTEA